MALFSFIYYRGGRKVLLFVGQEAWEENVQEEQNDDFRKEGRSRVSACQASYWVSTYMGLRTSANRHI